MLAGKPVSKRDVVVVGTSAGGLAALSELCQGLPADFPASVLVVQHIGAHPSSLHEILSARGRLDAVQARQGQGLEHGKIYVAPPDRHMLVEGYNIVLTHGPKENYARPAVDPLFRSAALSLGSSVIGVVLTGHLDDGTAGMQAVKQCGGLALVQNPAEATPKVCRHRWRRMSTWTTALRLPTLRQRW